MGKKIIVGNWKMNLSISEASLLVHRLDNMIDKLSGVEVILSPGFLALQSVGLQIEKRKFKLAAQNLYWKDKGAFTGEVSANQLRGLVKYAIIGHSERRHVFGEQNKDIRNKVQAAFRNQIVPILCVGETASDRAANEMVEVLHDQIVSGLANITSEEAEKMIIAYEPVWAVGTGDNALPEDVEIAAKEIRKQIQHLFGEKASDAVKILYGGSVNPDNAQSYMRMLGVDGLLIGQASLNAHNFAKIINETQGKVK